MNKTEEIILCIFLLQSKERNQKKLGFCLACHLIDCSNTLKYYQTLLSAHFPSGCKGPMHVQLVHECTLEYRSMSKGIKDYVI